MPSSIETKKLQRRPCFDANSLVTAKRQARQWGPHLRFGKNQYGAVNKLTTCTSNTLIFIPHFYFPTFLLSSPSCLFLDCETLLEGKCLIRNKFIRNTLLIVHCCLQTSSDWLEAQLLLQRQAVPFVWKRIHNLREFLGKGRNKIVLGPHFL